MSTPGSLGLLESFDSLETDELGSKETLSSRGTPILSSTPNRRTPTLTSPKFHSGPRSQSSSAKEDKAVLAYRNLLQSRLLITQPNQDEDADDELYFGVRDGRTSRDTDYETDLEMDFDEWVAEENEVLADDASQEKKYIYICNQTGTIPVSYFLKHISNAKFRMRHHGLGPLGAKAIALPLKDNHIIEILDLEGNWIEKEGAEHIANMLKENIYITEMNLAENHLGRDGADAICDVLLKHEFLRSLNLSGNELHNKGAQKICEMLQKNITLKHLYLSNNKFEDQAAIVFKQALGHNENLETLDISWNHFRSQGAVAIAEGVQENYGLKTLNVSMNGFSDMGAEALGRALKHNRGLKDLDVSHNRITEQGAGHIALGLQTNDILQYLKIGYNPLGEDGSLALIVAISKNDVSCMDSLDLSDVFVTTEFRDVLRKLEGERLFTAIHAGVLLDNEEHLVSEKEILDTFRRNPYRKLATYTKQAGYRLLDLFKDFDKDGSMTITRDEFENGIKLAGVKMTQSELNTLIQMLDRNNDGVIEYRICLLAIGNSRTTPASRVIPRVYDRKPPLRTVYLFKSGPLVQLRQADPACCTRVPDWLFGSFRNTIFWRILVPAKKMSGSWVYTYGYVHQWYDPACRSYTRGPDWFIRSKELLLSDKDYKKKQKDKEECPDERQLQRAQNRISRERSDFLSNIIDS